MEEKRMKEEEKPSAVSSTLTTFEDNEIKNFND